MGTAFEPPPPQPLNARRPAAPPLPNLGGLPVPSFNAAQKYSQSHLHHLPPPNPITTQYPTVALDVTTAATSATIPVSASPDSAYWAQGSYSSARQPSWTPGLSSSYSNRDPFSPSFHPNLHRNPATSTPGADSIPPVFDMNHHLPPFQVSQPPPHPAMAHHPPLPSNDPYMAKSSSAPAYATLQHLSSPPGYQPYPGPPPPLAMQHPPRVASNPPPPLNYQRQPWPSYSLPAMAGPVMSNVHSPSGQMSILGPLQSGILPGFNSGHVASMQQMYGGHPPHLTHGIAGPTNDRPFKCDQCPQSFNRNHDLKRHRRIHLAVKPFPCHHCDKSFSRKDALKRHRLVKGCDKGEDSKVKEEDNDEGASPEH
ncbi:hypothetical protein BJX99DRAFT_8605 [Aspergillus californicus]